MNPPVFLEIDPEVLLNETIAYYESLTGNTLQPAQVERLILNSIAYRESLVRKKVQDSAVQMLLRFSTAPVLDYLVELLGVERLEAQFASCTLRFTLTANPAGVVIPNGTRVASVDGRVVFATEQDITVAATVLTVDIDAVATVAGESANGYVAGDINKILDPQSYIDTVENTNETAGGSGVETDEALRERAKLAANKFSVAGPEDAYKYFAFTASPLIIDVEVDSPTPGLVEIYPLMFDGSTTPSQILDAVDEICNATDVRPLTDKVDVIAPTPTNYSLTCNLTIYDTADSTTTQNAVEAALEDYVLAKRQSLGQDVTLTQLKHTAGIDGVYEADFGAFATLVIPKNGFAFNTGITVNVIGTTAG